MLNVLLAVPVIVLVQHQELLADVFYKFVFNVMVHSFAVKASSPQIQGFRSPRWLKITISH